MISQIANTWYDRERVIWFIERAAPSIVSAIPWDWHHLLDVGNALVADRNRNDIAAAAVNEVVDRRIVNWSPYPSADSYGESSGRTISMFLRPTLSVIAESLPFDSRASRMRSEPQWWLNTWAGPDWHPPVHPQDFNNVVAPITGVFVAISANRFSSNEIAIGGNLLLCWIYWFLYMHTHIYMQTMTFLSLLLRFTPN